MACNLKYEHATLDNVTLLGNILKCSLVITGFLPWEDSRT